MGADYYLYTEVKRTDGRWHALNGMYYNESTGHYELAETYHSGSRTYFSQTYNKLREIGSLIKAGDLSKEVLNKELWLDVNDNDYIISVSVNTINQTIPQTSRHQCCGYVHKSHIWDFEIDGDEIEDYLTTEEYCSLSNEEKREYEFYEWDDPMGWYLTLKEIKEIIKFQIDEYMRVNYALNEPPEVRLICIASY